MNIFAFTRIRLTMWYVCAIMLVSLMFSFVIYKGVTQNIEDVFFRAEIRMRKSPRLNKNAVQKLMGHGLEINSDDVLNKDEILEHFFNEEVKHGKRKALTNLIYANIIIFILSTLLSYMLADKTLQPIEETLIEQKRFIADASHELRTPLTSLKTSIEVSLRDKSLNKQSKKILKDNLEDVDSLKNLIDRLLQLSSQENKIIVKQLIDIHEVVTKSIKMIKPLAKAKEIELVNKLEHKQLLASDTGLTKLFTILLENAVKYSNVGGKIDTEIKSSKKCVYIKITDNGIGINRKYLSHIFDRFYRIDSSRTVSQRPGFGLGLSVARQIVKNHKGEISVNSLIGKGTSFTVRIPV
jgi:two-component system sensor histidine kinase CiaH